MPTIDSKKIIKELLRNDGKYPQAVQIARYKSDWDGGESFHVAYNSTQVGGFLLNQCVHDPELLWTREGGLTDAGKALLEEK